MLIKGSLRPAVYLLGSFVFACVASSSSAQESAKIMLANLKQDLELVSRDVGGLRSEVEMLRRENAQLRVQLNQIQRTHNQDQGKGNNDLIELQTKVRALELSFNQSERSRISTQEELNIKFQQIIEQMNRGFEQVTSVKSSTAKSAGPTFSTDYPKNGFVHKVGKGETVSSIAQKYKSKVSWIIDANQIADPTKVFVGRELFVPQK